jgi:putative ABC transport system ATP-binding protein
MLPFTYYPKTLTDTEKKERAMKAIEEVGLLDKFNNKSNQLSGGQVQRTAIARSLVLNPKIILADEPTGNLDSKTSVEVMDVLTVLNKKGHTIILVTHEEDIAKYAKRRVRLKDGVILDDDKN